MEEKGFTWEGWVQPVNQYKGGYHVTGWNRDGSFEHYHQDKDGNRTECTCKTYEEADAKSMGLDF